MRTKIYWSGDYFYSVAVDDEGNEYMPYKEYLFIRDRVKNIAVTFEFPPQIENDEVKYFDVISLNIKRVQKLNDKLFILYADNKHKRLRSENIITDGSTTAYISKDVINFIINNFDVNKIRFIKTLYNTSVDFGIYVDDKMLLVYNNRKLRVDPKTLNISSGEKERSIVEVIDFKTSPTTKKVFELYDGKVVYHGRAYVKDIYIRPGKQYFGKKDLRGIIKDDVIIKRTKNGIKIIDKEKPYYSTHMKRRVQRKDPEKLYDVRRFRTFFYKIITLGTIKTVFEWNGDIYYAKIPLFVYLYGSRKFIVKNYAKKLPMRVEGNEIVIDFENMKKYNTIKTQKKYKIFGFEAIDIDYALMIKKDNTDVILPLMWTNVETGEKKYFISLEDYKFLMGDDSVSATEYFGIYKYDVIPSDKTNAEYSSTRVRYKKVDTFKGYRIPRDMMKEPIIQEYGDYVKAVHYVPARDGYVILFEVEKGYIIIDRWREAYFMPKGLDVLFVLNIDYKTVRVMLSAYDIEWHDGLNTSYDVDDMSGFMIFTSNEGVKGMTYYHDTSNPTGKKIKRVVDSKNKIYYPIKRPEYMVVDGNIYIGFNGRPFRKVADFIPVKNLEVLSCEYKDNYDYISIKLRDKRNGDTFVVNIYDDEWYEICDLDGRLYTAPSSLDSLFALIKAIDMTDLKTTISMV